MAFISNRFVDGWETHPDGPAAPGVSHGEGRPSGRVHVPGERHRRPLAIVPVTVGNIAIVKEFPATAIERGHRFELDADTLLSWEAVKGGMDLPSGSRMPLDATKCTVLFARRPTVARVEFAFTFGEQSLWLPQPALTVDEVKEGCKRPDYVVGSYAVKDTGGVKLGHLYRPFVVDADDEWAWCDLQKTPTGFAVLLPVPWLLTAHYPVTLDPTFGASAGGGSESYFYLNYEYCCSETALPAGAAGGTVTKIGCYQTTADYDPRQYTLYSDDGTDPQHLRDYTAETNAGATADWVDVDGTQSHTLGAEGTVYWPGCLAGGSGSNYTYDTVAAKMRYSGRTYALGPSNPWPAPGTAGSRDIAMRVTYTEAGEPAAGIIPLMYQLRRLHQ